MRPFFFDRNDPRMYAYSAPYMAPCGTGVLVHYDARYKPEKDQFEEHLDTCEKCKEILEEFDGSYEKWIEDGTGMRKIQDEIHRKVMEELEKNETKKHLKGSERSNAT